jgi:hypothetical protein
VGGAAVRRGGVVRGRLRDRWPCPETGAVPGPALIAVAAAAADAEPDSTHVTPTEPASGGVPNSKCAARLTPLERAPVPVPVPDAGSQRRAWRSQSSLRDE